MTDKRNTLLDIASDLALVSEVDLIPVSFKRLVTKDGLEAGKQYKIGQTVLISKKSLRGKHVIFKDGKELLGVPVVNIVGENGEDRGYIWAELFYD